MTPSIPHWPGANVGWTKLMWTDISSSISTLGGIFPSNALMMVVSTRASDRSFVNRQAFITWPFSTSKTRAPWRSTDVSSGPLNSIRSRKKGLLATTVTAVYSSPRLRRHWSLARKITSYPKSTTPNGETISSWQSWGAMRLPILWHLAGCLLLSGAGFWWSTACWTVPGEDIPDFSHLCCRYCSVEGKLLQRARPLYCITPW